MCVYVCVRARAREYMRACTSASVCVCVWCKCAWWVTGAGICINHVITHVVQLQAKA